MYDIYIFTCTHSSRAGRAAGARINNFTWRRVRSQQHTHTHTHTHDSLRAHIVADGISEMEREKERGIYCVKREREKRGDASLHFK